MKAKLLKKLRKINVIYKRNNEYRYCCEILCDGDVWAIDTGWTTDLKKCQKKRRKKILEMARNEYKFAK